MLAEPAGSRFGRYSIVRASGAGGMGRVQLALLPNGQEPEVCIIKRTHTDDRVPEQDARFEREARIAARLSHPNIARTLRVESIEGELCLIQEFIDGVNLSRLMRQMGAEPLAASAVAQIGCEVAQALEYAHGFGEMEIVHRDVTPENIMLSYAGEVKLIDFGISRSRVDGTLTSLGAVVGRRAYMPPEVWAGGKPDRRADVFALGVVLWEMATARRLEEMDDVIWTDLVPDPRSIRPEVSSELAAVILHAVAPNPADRYQTAAELGAALAEFIDHGKDPKADLAGLLALYFNVERDRSVLAEQIEDAKRALIEPPSMANGRASSRARGVWVIAAVGGIVFASGIAISGLRRGKPMREVIPAKVAAASLGTAVAPTPGPVPAPSLRPAPTEPLGRLPSAGAAPRSARAGRVAATSGVAPDLPKRQEPVATVLREANDAFDDGRLTDAIALAHHAAASGGGAKAHALLGYIYMSQGQLSNAERELAQAVRADPSDTEATKRLADVKRARAEQGP